VLHLVHGALDLVCGFLSVFTRHVFLICVFSSAPRRHAFQHETCHPGVVTLAGRVKSTADRENAGRLACSGKGVKVVYDEIQIQARAR
jgi:hypothetical protein